MDKVESLNYRLACHLRKYWRCVQRGKTAMKAILHGESTRRSRAAAIWITGAVCFASSVMAQTPSARVPVAYPDTWGAIDGLGRILPDYQDVGGIKKNKTVGIFYFLTRVHTGHVILNNDLVLQKHPNAIIGPMYSTHWWAEPLFGYYRSSDPFVLRVHAEMLSDAGVNTVIFDNTNGPIYLSVQKALFKTWLHLRALGDKTPQFACFAGNGAWNKVYNSIY